MRNLPCSSVVAEPTGSPFSLLTVIFTSGTGTSSLESAVPFLSINVPRTDVSLTLDDESLPDDDDESLPDVDEADEPESDDDDTGGCCARAGGAKSCTAAISPASTA